MKDVAPELLEEIKEEFQKRFDKNEEIKRLYEKVRKKNASYKDAHKFAEETGEILAEAFGTAIFPERLPDGRMYYNIANRIIPEMLKKNYDLTTDISMDIQKIINENAGIGIKAIRPKFNEDKVQGIVNIVSGKEEYEKIAYMLVEPIVNFTQSIVDDAAVAMIQGADGAVSGMAMSPTFSSALAKLKANGVRLYPELAWGGNPGAINGLKVDVNNTVSFGKSKDVAIVGDFQNAFKWGYAKEIPIEVIPYGDPDNSGVDLKGSNQVYIRGEVYVGWGILIPESFARIESEA